ncbi:MAG TPA: signal peptidase I [Patescibacteria group bacterium]|nr:signal peptidase I [Patescibacteria group bacterium]
MQGQLLIVFILVVSALGLTSFILPLLLRTPSPFVVVMSGSMEPSLRPGDLLVVEGYRSRGPDVGDVVVYRSRRYRRVIVHRVVSVDESRGDVTLFTKGDAVEYADREPVEMGDVLGSVRWRVGWLGFPSYFLWRALGRLEGESNPF